MTQQQYDEAVAAFIRDNGVTRCPTVCAVHTQASVAAADRVALGQRHAEEEARRERRRLRRASLYRFGSAA